MIVAILAVLGLCFGSFVNALVWRVHEQDTRKKLTAKQRKELSMLHGRSMCPYCHHTLAWYDLLPVVSWLSLGGKCRYCHRPIEDSPIVEIMTALLFVGSYYAWPYGFEALGTTTFVLWLVFLVGFVALAVYDLRWMLLPNRMVYPLIGLTVIQLLATLTLGDDRGALLLEAFWGFAVTGGLFYGLFQISGGKWIGGGDVKLGFIIGPLVGGPTSGVLLIFVASFLGTIAALPLMAKKKLGPTSRIPFGPFLLVATVIVYLFGQRIADWYITAFL